MSNDFLQYGTAHVLWSMLAGPREVAELLRRHPKRPELQHRGLRAFRDFAYEGELVGLLPGGVLIVPRLRNYFCIFASWK